MIILNSNQELYIFLIILTLLIIYLLIVLLMVLIIDKKYFNKRINNKTYINNQTIEDYKNIIKEDFTFYSNKNKLIGNIYYDNKQFDNIIIFCNGYNTVREKYLKEISFFCNLGYTVFAYDYTGTGDSDGKSLRGAPQSIIDLENCLKAIIKQYPNSNITLVGHSMGAYAVCNILNIYNVKKVIAIAPFNNIVNVVNDNVKNKFGKKIFLFNFIYNLMLRFRFGKYASYSTYDTLKYVNNEVLVIHGIADKTVLVDKCLNSAMNNINMFIKFMILDNKGHEPLLSEDAINYNLYLKHYLENLKIKYGNNIPNDEIELLNKNINYELKNKLDEEVISVIKKFLN